VCKTNDNCYSKICKNEVCSPDLTKENNCERDEDCAAGKYCASDDKHCYDIKLEGRPCSKNSECGWLAGCFEDPDSFVQTCKHWGSIKNGFKIGKTKIQNPYYFCESLHSEFNEEDQETYCMPAPVSDQDVTKGFNDFKYCSYWQFKDPLDLSKKTTGITPGPAKCGFN
jgi:hypothetical protein